MNNERSSIRKMYPRLTEEELKISEENFDKYIEFCWQVYERLRSDPKEYLKFLNILRERFKSR